MNEARAVTTAQIANSIGLLVPQSDNKERTLAYLNGLSDKEFDDLMHKYLSGEAFPFIMTQIGKKEYALDNDTLIKAAETLGHNFNKHVQMVNPDGSKEVTNAKVFVIDLPIRVQAQLIAKKVAIPKNNNSIDYYTGQATGASKGSRISYPEIMYLLSMGLTRTVEECMTFRGGSEKGMNLIEQSISQIGEVSADAIKPYIGQVGATNMLHQYFYAMGLDDNLFDKQKRK